jgi:hypothetical protein
LALGMENQRVLGRQNDASRIRDNMTSGKGPRNLDDTRVNQEAIGARLREMFDEVVNEPIPDEFLDLLRQADDRAPVKDPGERR